MKRSPMVVCWILASQVFSAALAESEAIPRQSTFEVRQKLEVQIPEKARVMRVWVPLPLDDPAQKVRKLAVAAPYPYRLERDSENNRHLFLELRNPSDRSLAIDMSFELSRSEVIAKVDAAKSRPLSAAERVRFRKDLQPNTYIPVDQPMRELAGQILGGETNPVRIARRLYDWIIENSDYYAKDPKRLQGSDEGNSSFCLKNRTGNCADMGSLWISLVRAREIPARMVYGSFFKPDLNGRNQDVNAHSWVEFYAPGIGWVPADVSLGDIYSGDFQITSENRTLLRLATPDATFGKDPRKREYYFGSLDERRMAWSRGRDLMLRPRQAGAPVNALFEAYVEVDGKPFRGSGQGWLRTVTYRQVL